MIRIIHGISGARLGAPHARLGGQRIPTPGGGTEARLRPDPQEGPNATGLIMNNLVDAPPSRDPRPRTLEDREPEDESDESPPVGCDGESTTEKNEPSEYGPFNHRPHQDLISGWEHYSKSR